MKHRTRRSILIVPSLFSLAASLSGHAQDAAPAPAVATPPATSTQAAPEAPKLPAIASILEKSVEAIGGREAWLKINSMQTKGTISMPALNMSGAIESWTIAPNRMFSKMTLTGFGEIRTGFDGTHAWSIEPSTGPRLLEKDERDVLVRESAFYASIEPLKHWDSIEVVGEGSFGGFDCWKVTAKRGSRDATLWFEKETGLQRGNEMTVDTQFGKIPVVNTILEYRQFGDIKLGTRTETSQMGQKMVAVLESATFNMVDVNAVAIPKEIEALLQPEPAEEGDEVTAPTAPAAPGAPAAKP